MERDTNGNPVIYVIYDRSRSGTTTGWWRVAHFKFAKNAQTFLDEQQNENYVISCQSGSARDFSLARD
jgi:hypothetical protein